MNRFKLRSRRIEWLISLALTLILVSVWLLFTEIRILPFRCSINSREFQGYRQSRFFDLDGDRAAERIEFCTYGEFAAVEVFSSERKLLYVKRLEGRWPPDEYAGFFGDSDRDGKGEIFCITHFRDSLFLHHLYGFNKGNAEYRRIYLGMTQQRKESYDFSLMSGTVIDVNGDSTEEAVFHIHAGYSLIPRKIYIYDPDKQNLVSSEDIGASYYQISFCDLDGDGSPEILTGSSSTENYQSEAPVEFGDNQAGAFIYESDLTLYLPPLVFYEGRPYANLFPLIRDQDTLIGCTVYRMESDMPDSLIIYNRSLQHIKSFRLPFRFTKDVVWFGPGEDPVYYFGTGDNTIFEFDSQKFSGIQFARNGSFIRLLKHDPELDYDYRFIKNGNQVLLVDRKLNACSNVLKGLGNVNAIELVRISPSSGRKYAFYDYPASLFHLVTLSPNGLFPVRIIVYFASLAVFFMTIYLITWLIRYLYLRRRMLEYRLQLTEIQSVHDRMHPHFTFNVLNSIGSYIYSEERDKAYRHLIDVSDMLRVVLDNTERSTWRLEDELKFVRLYVKLENLRFSGAIDYLEEIEQNVDQSLLVPKMMIQTFVENAIQHGLVPRRTMGRLVLEVEIRGKHLNISIIDNGIGREQSTKIAGKGTGNGIRLVESYMKHYNRLFRDHFSLEISDIIEDSNAIAGTRVDLEIPLNLKRMEL